MATKTPQRRLPDIPEKKGAELVGLLLLTLAILLAASLLSFRPSDPSLFHELAEGAAGPQNWIGRIGADLAAICFGLLGWAAAIIPVMLLVSSLGFLKKGETPPVPGRLFAMVLALISGPILLHLCFGELTWRGESFATGGFLGSLQGGFLEKHLNFMGATLVSLSLAAIAISLFVKSTLVEVLWHGAARIKELSERLRFRWTQKRQKKDKENQRRRVLTKHLERRKQERKKSSVGPVMDSPIRVVKKKGAGRFSVRRVKKDSDSANLDTSPTSQTTITSSPRSRRKIKKSKKELAQPTLFEPAPPSAETLLPPVNLLRTEATSQSLEEEEMIHLGEVIRASCDQFGVKGKIVGISAGPVITVFEFQPAPGVKVSQIVNLQDDLALVLKAEAVRIERLAGRSTLGIEVPNKIRSMIHLGHLFDQDTFKRAPSVLTMALGSTIHGEPYYVDLATMPHLLVAGATGSGKSVGLQSMITSILYKATRDEVQFIFIDPKRVELGVYSNIPHLKTDVVVEPKKAANALRWAVAEMERRYRLLAEVHVRSITYYNRMIVDPEVQKKLSLRDEGEETTLAEDLKPLPYYVIVIDELADLMMVASSDVEASIARLAQMARAVGIHLIVATQRPSVDVLTGTIKANFPCRIAFATTSRHDSRTILDQVGSEKLLGKGDMLIMPPGSSRLVRLHGAYVSEEETAALVRWLKRQGRPEIDPEVTRFEEKKSRTGGGDDEAEHDDLYDEAARLVVAERKASASFLQRRLRVGFSRAARLVDMMEQDALVGPSQGSKPRDVLVPVDYFMEVDAAREEP